MTDGLKILIIGGYGVFGGRIVALLEDEPKLTLFVAGRSIALATNFARSRNTAAARLIPIAFDRSGDVAGQLLAIRPDIVVDAGGPFQVYGDPRYRVVDACLAHNVNYLDLADGSDFVAGIGAFNDRAKGAGLYILSGVSSFPVLTAAAVRRLAVGMTKVKAIRGGIALSPYAGVGENVIRAIAGYAGRPIRRKRNGVFCDGYPLTEHLRYSIAPPGRVPLHNKDVFAGGRTGLASAHCALAGGGRDLDGRGPRSRSAASNVGRASLARPRASRSDFIADCALDAFYDQPRPLG
jgi:hypothetical protein